MSKDMGDGGGRARAHHPRWSRPVGRVLLGAYPEAWRARYRTEMLALLDDDPPGVRGLASLLAGALDAHVRPQRAWSAALPALARVRLSVGAIFACWIAVSLAGAGFQQTTDEHVFTAAAHHHPPLALARYAILAGAVLGAGAVAVGGIPLLWHAIARARNGRDRLPTRLLGLPLLAIAGFALLTRVLVAFAPGRGGGFPTSFVLGVGAPWLLAAIACALVCALTPKAALRRLTPPASALRRAFRAGLALALAMCLVTVALLAYELSLCLQAPVLSAQASGPVGSSNGAMLAGQCLLSAIATVLALGSAARARVYAR